MCVYFPQTQHYMWYSRRKNQQLPWWCCSHIKIQKGKTSFYHQRFDYLVFSYYNYDNYKYKKYIYAKELFIQCKNYVYGHIHSRKGNLKRFFCWWFNFLASNFSFCIKNCFLGSFCIQLRCETYSVTEIAICRFLSVRISIFFKLISYRVSGIALSVSRFRGRATPLRF